MRKFGKNKYSTHANLKRFEQSENRCSNWFRVLKEEFIVERKTKYQLRLNNQIDIYPKNKRYHILKDNERGNFEDLKELRIILKSLLVDKEK